MTLTEKQELAEKIVHIAKQAGKMIAETKATQVTQKSSVADVVTDMDLKSQQFIIQECGKLLPDSAFLAEEEGRQTIGAGFTWVIDPIDGTTNYMYQYQHSCVSIALYEHGHALIGVIYNPYLDECFMAIDECQSTCNGVPIHVSENPMSKGLVLIGTSPYHKHLAQQSFSVFQRIFLAARDLRRSGSAALDLCYVAAGRADAFYEAILQPWDYAAGLLILQQAGGVAKASAANAFEQLQPTGVLCSNAVCHEDFCGLIEQEIASN